MATSTLGSGTLVLAGTTSGTTTVTATAVAGTTTLTLPAATDTLVGKATTDTLTNKTLTGAVMNGTLGATTPSTGAFTTISATGDLTQSSAAARIAFSSAAGNGGFQNDNASAYLLLYGSTHATLAKNVVLNSDSGAIRLKSTGTDIAVATSTGLAVTGLTDISAATSGQIKFPATQNASSNANTLDDYEEGTFTPTLKFGGGQTGMTFTLQLGSYTKIGQLVTGRFIIILSNKGSSTGGATIDGLPFTVGSVLGSALTEIANNFTLSPPTAGYVNASQTDISLFAMGATGNANTSETSFANNTRLDMWFQYFV